MPHVCHAVRHQEETATYACQLIEGGDFDVLRNPVQQSQTDHDVEDPRRKRQGSDVQLCELPRCRGLLCACARNRHHVTRDVTSDRAQVSENRDELTSSAWHVCRQRQTLRDGCEQPAHCALLG